MRADLASLAEVVRQELGREPGKSSMESLVNEAGEAWVNIHEWLYLQEREQSIEIQTGVESYRLGAGVRAVGDELFRPNEYYRPMTVIDWPTFIEEKRRYLADLTRLYDPLVTIHWDTREGDANPYLYLEVFPARITETVYFRYTAGWLPLDKQSDVADLPPPMVQPFKEFLRRYALGREKPGEFNLDAMQATFIQGPQGMAAKRSDARHGGRLIPAHGGAGAVYHRMKARRRIGVGTRGYYGRFCQLDYLRLR